MNYTELSAAITSWLENEEATFGAEKDRFIRLGERRIYVALELPATRKNATSNMTVDSPYLQLPTDTISVYDIAIVVSGSHTMLLRKEEGFIREAYPDVTATGTPVYYSIFDHNTVKIGPTPSTGFAVEMTYDGVPDSIVDTGTSWLGDNCERALLYASLVEGYTFMKGAPDLIDRYEKAFQEEIIKMNSVILKRAHSKDLFEGMFDRGSRR